MGETYNPSGEFLFNLSEDPSETNSLTGNKDLTTVLLLNYMRLRTLIMQLTGAPSLLVSFPPVIDLPPSPGNCWLPLDSPLFATAQCPGPTMAPTTPPAELNKQATTTATATTAVSHNNEQKQYILGEPINHESVGSEDKFTTVVGASMTI